MHQIRHCFPQYTNVSGLNYDKNSSLPPAGDSLPLCQILTIVQGKPFDYSRFRGLPFHSARIRKGRRENQEYGVGEWWKPLMSLLLLIILIGCPAAERRLSINQKGPPHYILAFQFNEIFQWESGENFNKILASILLLNMNIEMGKRNGFHRWLMRVEKIVLKV